MKENRDNVTLERKVLGSDPKSLQQQILFDSVGFGSSPNAVREYQDHCQDKQKRHELEQVTYQVFLPLCSASTDSPDLILLDLVCLFVCRGPSSRLCSGCQFCLVGYCWDTEGPGADCPRGVVALCWDLTKVFLLSPEPLSNLSVFETHHICSLFRYIVTSQKVKPILFCTFKAPSLLTFSFSCCLECFQKRTCTAALTGSAQHWFTSLLLNAPFLLLYVASLLEHWGSFQGNRNFMRSDCNWKQWDLQM